MKGDNLTVKQKAFADLYIQNGNATQSYKQAGYKYKSDKIAEANSNKLLGTHKVRRYVNEKMESISDDRIMTAQEILTRLTAIGRGEIGKKGTITNADGSTSTYEEEAEIKEQIKAMEVIMKRYPQMSETRRDDKVLAETEFIKERTKLLKGVQKDTSLLESLIKAVGP
jgi:phage terminase small subunit